LKPQTPLAIALFLLLGLAAAPAADASQRARPRPSAGAGEEAPADERGETAEGRLLERIELLEREVFDLQAARDAEGKRFAFSVYGVMNYYRRDWETDADAHDTFDVERLVPSLTVDLSERVWAAMEVEFEHGGTGATMELDKFEEFGEFEQEIEKGGEVVVEEFYAGIEQSERVVWRIGHFVLPVGLINRRHRPSDYFTGYRSEAETSMIPVVWHESGAALSGRIGSLDYELGIVTGLDSSGFSSGGWVREGHQTRFEEANAEDPAVYARLDWNALAALTLGAAGYQGNTTGNRPKPDLDVDAVVTIVEVDASVLSDPVTLRAQYMEGVLTNSEAVTQANKGLSNNLNVKRTPVGSKARAWFIEAGYDLFSLGGDSSDGGRETRLDFFLRYDDYDTMAATAGSVVDNAFWERRTATAGINWTPVTGLIVKAHQAVRTLGTDQVERTTVLGMGIDY
jgi:hypothetical protein